MLLTVLWGQRLRTIGLKHRLHLNYEQKALRFINLSGLLLSHIHSPFQFLSVSHVIQAASSQMGRNTYAPYIDESTDTQRCEATLWQGKEKRVVVTLMLLTVTDMQLKTCSDSWHRLKWSAWHMVLWPLLSFIHPSHDVPWVLGVGHGIGASTWHRSAPCSWFFTSFWPVVDFCNSRHLLPKQIHLVRRGGSTFLWFWG